MNEVLFKDDRDRDILPILRSESGYVSCIAVIILCISKKFRSGILKLFEGNYYQGIKLHIIYFSLTDINIRTVIILFSIHVPSIHTHLKVCLMNLCGICDLFTQFYHFTSLVS